MTTTLAPTKLVSAGVDALMGARWGIAEAVAHVPRLPGLYAIYGDIRAAADLGLTTDADRPLYVGKAEESLVSRELNGHFAALPGSAAQTGSSTVRRSFAALLREPLKLRAVPRNPSKPGYFANYGLADGGDDRLTEWMHQRLKLAVWPAPSRMESTLNGVETSVIRHFRPPINLAKNPGRLAILSRARAEMAAEAAAWIPVA